MLASSKTWSGSAVIPTRWACGVLDGASTTRSTAAAIKSRLIARPGRPAGWASFVSLSHGDVRVEPCRGSLDRRVASPAHVLIAWLHVGKNVWRSQFGSPRVERRGGRVLDDELHRLSVLGAGDLGHDGEGEVDAGSDAPARDDIAVAHH